jgi:hypothetical protein
LGLGSKLTTSLWKELCGYLLIKKIHLLVVMHAWNQKRRTGHLTGTTKNGKFYIDSHSKFVIGTQYIM